MLACASACAVESACVWRLAYVLELVCVWRWPAVWWASPVDRILPAWVCQETWLLRPGPESRSGGACDVRRRLTSYLLNTVTCRALRSWRPADVRNPAARSNGLQALTNSVATMHGRLNRIVVTKTVRRVAERAA